jgi:tol-pal system protein YbgF
MQSSQRRTIRALARFAPVAFLATGACVATRNDVRILQQDLAVMRTESAQRDSARARRLEDLLAQLGRGNDSLSAVSQRLLRFQGEALGDTKRIQEMLIQVQELTGQSQRVIRELRADLEQAAETGGGLQPSPSTSAPSAPPTPGDTTAAAPRPATGPGPTQLYEQATAQLRRGSTGAARDGFQQLLARFPQSDLAPDAQFYVGETFAAEQKGAQADSTYRLVAERWPNAPRTAQALYKLGLSLQRQGRRAEARAALEDVVRRFPRSDEAQLARDRLTELRG